MQSNYISDTRHTKISQPPGKFPDYNPIATIPLAFNLTAKKWSYTDQQNN